MTFCVSLGTFQVGTGFSFTQNDSGYATNEVEVGANLYKSVCMCVCVCACVCVYTIIWFVLFCSCRSAMVQFFTVYVEYQAVDFYITGEVLYDDV